MPSRYDEAVTELYQAPLAGFVAERKRLAAALKAAGDKEGAGKLGKLRRPPVSAWAVNQLWWHNRRDMEAMLETAERLRAGDLGAAPAHREAIAKLRARASAILEKAEHGATEATLRRVTTTLSAIAAAGGFEPDLPGTLTDDRDPPGFETMALGAAAAAAAHHAKAKEDEEEETAAEEEEETEETEEKAAARGKHEKHDKHGKSEKHDKPTAAERRREAAEEKHRRAAEEARERAEEARRRAEEAAEKRRLEQETARKKAQRERVQAALRTAHGEVKRLERDLDKLRAQVTHAEDRLVRAKEIAADLEGKLAELE
jgi:DNA repair exonuclease SbcCD ATPase subunit